MEIIQITDDQFVEQFEPVPNHLDINSAWGGSVFETYGPELQHIALINMLYPDHVWTLSEGDKGMYISNGLSFVNRFGYFITKEPAPQDVWTIATDPDDHEFLMD